MGKQSGLPPTYSSATRGRTPAALSAASLSANSRSSSAKSDRGQSASARKYGGCDTAASGGTNATCYDEYYSYSDSNDAAKGKRSAVLPTRPADNAADAEGGAALSSSVQHTEIRETVVPPQRVPPELGLGRRPRSERRRFGMFSDMSMPSFNGSFFRSEGSAAVPKACALFGCLVLAGGIAWLIYAGSKGQLKRHCQTVQQCNEYGNNCRPRERCHTTGPAGPGAMTGIGAFIFLAAMGYLWVDDRIPGCR